MAVKIDQSDAGNLEVSDEVGFPATDADGIVAGTGNGTGDGAVTEVVEIVLSGLFAGCLLDYDVGDGILLGPYEQGVADEGCPELIRVGGIGCAAVRFIHG